LHYTLSSLFWQGNPILSSICDAFLNGRALSEPDCRDTGRDTRKSKSNPRPSKSTLSSSYPPHGSHAQNVFPILFVAWENMLDFFRLRERSLKQARLC